jgi:hypothetical protein
MNHAGEIEHRSLGERAGRRRAKESEPYYQKNGLWKSKFRSQRIVTGAYNAACPMDHPR